jgi:hypothetical protein
MDLTLTTNTEVSAAPGITAFDFCVMHEQLRVGRIRQEDGLRPGSRWIWALTGVLDGPNAMRRAGVVATIEEAQAALKVSWEQWLAWAGLSEREPAADESSAASAHSDENQDDDLFGAVDREAHLAERR